MLAAAYMQRADNIRASGRRYSYFRQTIFVLQAHNIPYFRQTMFVLQADNIRASGGQYSHFIEFSWRVIKKSLLLRRKTQSKSIN